MALHDVIGQEKVAWMLQNALRRGRLAHAYIFTGPDCISQKKMALELAKALNCTAHEDDACGQCTHCIRIAHGNFSDVHWIKPEGQSVKIDQIRSLQKYFSYHSAEAAVKVFIIEAAETMTLQAANSLLKFLEEPVGVVVAILLTENKHAILPTILSRCQIVSFQAVPPETVAAQLEVEGVPQEEATIAAGLANNLEEAKQMVQTEWLTRAREIVVNLTEAILTRVGRALVIVQEELLGSEVGRSYLEYFLDLMILWYQDMLNIRLGRHHSLTFLEQMDDINKQATKWTVSGLMQAVEGLLSAKQQLRQHVPPQLVMEGWILSVQEG